MNKKIIFLLLAAICFGTQLAGARIIYVPLYIVDPKPDVQGPTKTPNLQLFVTQDDHHLTFPPFTDKVEVQLLRKDEPWSCSLDTIRSGVTSLDVPRSYQGDYEIRFVAQDYYYYGFITFDVKEKKDSISSAIVTWSNVTPLISKTEQSAIFQQVSDLNVVECQKTYTIEALENYTPEQRKQLKEYYDSIAAARHIGLLPEEVMKAFPQLSATFRDEEKELFSILVCCIKELKQQLEDRTDYLVQVIMSRGDGSSVASIRASLGSRLCTITPIPAKEQAVVEYLVADGVQEACICICDMSGKMLQKVPVNPRDTSVTVSCSGMSSGLYLCSLVVNGMEVNTRRMLIAQ